MLSDENGLHISQRNLTISTCGIVPKIRELAEEKLQITLALSLHATTDEKRKALMPIANTYALREVLEACGYYHKQTGRRVTFEYSLVGGVNDTKEDARELIAIAAKYAGHVNLIPVNPIKERNYKNYLFSSASILFSSSSIRCVLSPLSFVQRARSAE